MSRRTFRDPVRKAIYAEMLPWSEDGRNPSRALNDAWFYGRRNPGKPCPPLYRMGAQYAAWAAGADGAQPTTPKEPGA